MTQLNHRPNFILSYRQNAYSLLLLLLLQLFEECMISHREEGVKKMGLSGRVTAKSPKLASMANIANRSPVNKQANLLASKRQLLENRQKIDSNASNQPNNRKLVKNESIETQNNRVENRQNQQNIKFTYGPEKSQSPLKAITPPKLQISKRVSSGRTKNEGQIGQLQSGKTISFANGDKYEGQLLDGQCYGKGFYLFKTRNMKYQGEFLKGKQHGYGILINLITNEPIYEGNWQYGMKNGEGRYTYDRDVFYNGEWINDQKHGVGIYNYEEGCYNGSWLKNKREGKGSLKLNNSTEFKGTFVDNYFVKGFVKYPNGDEYSGQMKNNRRQGDQGYYMQAITKIRYKGSWFNDKKHGKGTITYENGDELTGTFSDGNLNQQYEVKYKWRDGSVFNGWFNNNQANKGTVSLPNGQKWQI